MAVRGEKEKDTYPGVNIPIIYNAVIFEGFTFRGGCYYWGFGTEKEE